ncbi:MAG: TetR/AcrR family transcriptional regulator [Brevinematales bacterium]
MTIIDNILQNSLSDLDKKILEEARKAFLIYGYAGTNVDQVAHHLRIGKGTIYRHFHNKAFLFLSVVIYTYQEMIVHFQPIPQIENPDEAFHAYLKTLIKLNYTIKPFFSLLNPLEFGREFQHECGTNPEINALMQRFQKEKNEGLAFLTQIIEKLKQKHSIKSPLEASKIARMIFVLVNNYLRDEPSDPSSLQKTTDDLLYFIHHAIEYTSSIVREESL